MSFGFLVNAVTELLGALKALQHVTRVRRNAFAFELKTHGECCYIGTDYFLVRRNLYALGISPIGPTFKLSPSSLLADVAALGWALAKSKDDVVAPVCCRKDVLVAARGCLDRPQLTEAGAND
jgi:hypothetical protein